MFSRQSLLAPTHYFWRRSSGEFVRYIITGTVQLSSHCHAAVFGCSKSNDPTEELTDSDYDADYLSSEAGAGLVDSFSLFPLECLPCNPTHLPLGSGTQVLYRVSTVLRRDWSTRHYRMSTATSCLTCLMFYITNSHYEFLVADQAVVQTVYLRVRVHIISHI